MLIVMAPSGEMTRLLLAVHFLLLAVSIVNARVYFNGEDETKSGLLGLSEYGENDKADGTEEVDGQQNQEPQWKSGLYAAQHSLQSQYPSAAKRAWLPGAQTGMYGKPWLQNLALEPRWHTAVKRQLWANQQSGLFGKRDADMERTLPTWNVKRSAEDREFARQIRGGGVPHVFQSGGIFGKRSSDDWAKRYE